jgi:hypothetical protein
MLGEVYQNLDAESMGLIVFFGLIYSIIFTVFWAIRYCAPIFISVIFWLILFLAFFSISLSLLKINIILLIEFFIVAYASLFIFFTGDKSYKKWNWILKEIHNISLKELFWRVKNLKLFPYTVVEIPVGTISACSIDYSKGILTGRDYSFIESRKVSGKFFTLGNALSFIESLRKDSGITILNQDLQKREVLIKRYYV